MSNRLRPRLSFANVVSCLALFVALGGSAYAFHLGKNSVGSKQLKKNSVTTAKIKKQAVTAVKVKNGTLTGKQINASTLGKVPNAANADAVEGVGLSGLLRSDHVLTGSALADQPTAEFLLRDPRTGLEVLAGPTGRLTLVNTNTQDTIKGEGVGYAFSTPTATHLSLAPGAHIQLVYEAVLAGYAQLVFVRQPSGVSLQLSCLLNSVSGGGTYQACVAVG
jgi:hypothetical protein